jgi:hypothetical protein
MSIIVIGASTLYRPSQAHPHVYRDPRRPPPRRHLERRQAQEPNPPQGPPPHLQVLHLRRGQWPN